MAKKNIKTSNYTLADALIRIKNASAVYKKTVRVPRSKFIETVLNVLKKEGFIEDVQPVEDSPYELEVHLAYKDDVPPVPKVEHVKFFSKPGRAIYIRVSDIKPVRSGYGVQIISTPKGIMTTKEAKKQNVGGKLICEVW